MRTHRHLLTAAAALALLSAPALPAAATPVVARTNAPAGLASQVDAPAASSDVTDPQTWLCDRFPDLPFCQGRK